MANFVLTGDRYEAIPTLLLRAGQGFSISPEFRLIARNGEDLPGVVAAAYARYVARMMQESPSSVTRLFEPLNEIASWDDYKTNTMLKDEVVEQFQADGVLEALTPFFSTAMQKLLTNE
jgi:hypothetical protein